MEEEKGPEEARDMQGEDAEMMQRLQEEIRNLSVSDHLAYMMHSLSALAVGRLGLNTETAARRDLGQARLAIDAYRALMEVMERARSSTEIAAYRGVLSELQFAFVGATEAGTAAEGQEERADGGDEPKETRDESAEAADDSQQEAAGPGGVADDPKQKRAGRKGKRSDS